MKKEPEKEVEEVVVEDEKAPKASRKKYHVTKRSEDKKWSVKLEGGQKAIKLFNTKDEAVAYAKTLSENQDGGFIIHPSKGKNKGRFSSK